MSKSLRTSLSSLFEEIKQVPTISSATLIDKACFVVKSSQQDLRDANDQGSRTFYTTFSNGKPSTLPNEQSDDIKLYQISPSGKKTAM
jgi:hypothetical protein